MSSEQEELVGGVLDGDQYSLGRLLTLIENRGEGYRDAVKSLYSETGDSHVIGVTGSPGVGKSTLVDRVAAAFVRDGLSVGVLAVDPSSPFTGGSIMGDRIRMSPIDDASDIFFRSMSARGELGGLSASTGDAVTAMEASGKDVVLVETVGAGQNEVEVMKIVDTVAVVVTPSSGDSVQMLKAGILEIGDVFVVNKADLRGSDRMVMEVKDMVERGASDWKPPVLETVATDGAGTDELVDSLGSHLEYLRSSGEWEDRRRRRFRNEVIGILMDDLGEVALDMVDDGYMRRGDDPYSVAEEVVRPIRECLDDGG